MIDRRMDTIAAADINAVDDLASETWRRVPPAAILYYLVKFIAGIIRNGFQAIAPVAAIVATGGENRWFILTIATVVGGLAMLVGAVLSYLNFKFRMDGSNFLIRSGVLKRKRLTLSFDRIQNVALREPLYFRPLGLVILTLESAGSKSEEVHLAGIPRSIANMIRRHVLDWKDRQKIIAEDIGEPLELQDGVTEDSTDEIDLLQQPVSELAKYGLSNNNIFVFAGVGALLFSQLERLREDPITAIIADTVAPSISNSTGAIVASILFAALVILTVLIIASVVGAIIVNYNYHLTYGNQKYHRSRGLFDRQETSVPEVKIQSIRISQPFIARWLDRFHLTLQQVGFEGKDGRDKKQSFIVPSVTKSFSQTLVSRLFPGSTVLDLPLKSISHRFILRHAVYSVGIVSTGLSIFLAFTLGWIALVPLFAPVLFLPILVLRRRRYGYGMDGTHGVVRSGLFGHKLTVFPFFKVQTMEITQSPGQRKHHLANLKIKLAGRTLTIPYVPLGDAVGWRNTALLEVETNHKLWM